MSSRQVNFEVHCDTSQEVGNLRAIQEVSMCEYNIVFDSIHACPLNTGHGGWSIVATIIFVAAAYLGVGAAINRYQYDLRGIDLVPNLEFWKTVPELVKDGCIFSYVQSKAGAEWAISKYNDYRQPPI